MDLNTERGACGNRLNMNVAKSDYKKIHFSLFEIQAFLNSNRLGGSSLQNSETDMLIFGFLLGKSSHYFFKNARNEEFLTYLWDKVIYVNHLYSKKIINFRQKLSLSQIMIESQVDKINSNLDREINQMNGSPSGIRVNKLFERISFLL